MTATAKRSGFADHPGYRVKFEPCAKRVRVVLAGQTLADSTRTHLLRETGHVPVYYFPQADVRLDLLEASDHGSFCPFKGDARYWHALAGGRRVENAVWSYPAPFPEVAEIKETLAFYWNKMDAWFEEDEEVFVHARDPKVRIDVLRSERPLEVVVGGQTVAATRDARFLFETGLPTRYYIPRADVREEFLVPSETRSSCPYKGTASYYSVRVGGQLHEDLAWFYPDPLPEVAAVADRLCFFNEQVEALILDGEPLPRPNTKWSKDS